MSDETPGRQIVNGFGLFITGQRSAMASTIDRAVREAVKAEREACAKIAAEFGTIPHGYLSCDPFVATKEAADQIAEAIRNRQ